MLLLIRLTEIDLIIELLQIIRLEQDLLHIHIHLEVVAQELLKPKLEEHDILYYLKKTLQELHIRFMQMVLDQKPLQFIHMITEEVL